MASVAHTVDWPPVSLWQAPQYESWVTVPDGSVVGLVFRLSGNDVVIRAPLHIVIDIASHAFKKGLADDFQIGSWRWHSKRLMKPLQAMRDAFKKDQEFRRQVWRAMEMLGWLGHPQVKF
ncbi:hypothetical protein RHODOSMS8_00978 [Rhodobiaceae bacterium]|nr:hypothetical protein RHODOSMS8_00978 [Rhodobiaceae bacterium]